MHVLPFRCSEQGPVVPSYLRQWHTGNGIGRSSLCCSSLKVAPASWQWEHFCKGGRSQACQHPRHLSRPAQTPPARPQRSLCGYWSLRQDGLSISNRHSLTTSWTPSSSSVSGQASQRPQIKQTEHTQAPALLWRLGGSRPSR